VAHNVPVATSRGTLAVDIGFGGAFYAQLDVAALGLALTPRDLPALVALGREVKWALDAGPYARHPSDERLNGIYGTVLYEDLGRTPAGNVHQRNVAVFADGEVDRSPCGSGTASRVAVLRARGLLPPRAALVHDSMVGSRFRAVVEDEVVVDGMDAIVPVVTGTAFPTGEHVFVAETDDELARGFLLQ
jgi:proline racemase